MGSDHKKDKHKEKHKHKEKDKEKKRKRDKEVEGDGTQQQLKVSEATPRANKPVDAGKKTSETPAAPAHGSGDTGTKAKKRKSTAAAGDGGSSGVLAPAAAPQQQQQNAAGSNRQPPNPAAPTFEPLRDGDNTLASFRSAKPSSGPDQLRACWQLEGATATAVKPLGPIQRVLDGKAELWVLQLPAQMDAEALEGRVLKVDDRLLAHPDRSGVLGRLEIGDEAAAEMELVRSYALHQESTNAAAPLFIAAPTERASGTLEPLRPTRRLVVAEDVPAANTALVARAHAEAPELQFYPEPMPPARANALLQAEGRFATPPTAPPAGTWPPPGWRPAAALLERDRRRATRQQRGLPEVDPRDELEQQQLTDLRPAPGAPWGCAGGRALPPQWRALPGAEGARAAALGDVEQDVSIAYVYG